MIGTHTGVGTVTRSDFAVDSRGGQLWLLDYSLKFFPQPPYEHLSWEDGSRMPNGDVNDHTKIPSSSSFNASPTSTAGPPECR
jgi:hypothetical protein